MAVNMDSVKNKMKSQQQPQGAPPAPAAPAGNSIANYLKKNMKAMASVLPSHMTPERMARIALSEIRKNPQLALCTVESLGACIMQASALGLEPGTLGHAYFVPFNRNIAKPGQKAQWVKDVQFIIGYKGYIDLAHRSGDLETIKAFAVHENDHFVYKYGIKEELEHIPADTDRGAVKKYYAYALLKGGGSSFIVMSKESILEHAFTHSKQVKDGKLTGPWAKHFDSMAKKTVIRELIKYMPMSVEYQEKFATDEKIIKDVTPDDKDNIFDMEWPEDDNQEPAAEPQQEPQAEPEIIDEEPKKPEGMTKDEAAEWEKELEAARQAQAEIDKKKNKTK